jgi:hypothetical protein
MNESAARGKRKEGRTIACKAKATTEAETETEAKAQVRA